MPADQLAAGITRSLRKVAIRSLKSDVWPPWQFPMLLPVAWFLPGPMQPEGGIQARSGYIGFTDAKVVLATFGKPARTYPSVPTRYWSGTRSC
jgi:hypothetical protein